MITESYRVDGAIKQRYVTKVPNESFYRWCEQSLNNPRVDVAQGTCDAEDLPDEIRQKCDEYKGSFYACAWPKL